MESNKKPIIIAVVVTVVAVLVLGGGGVIAYDQLHHHVTLSDGGASFAAGSGGSSVSLDGQNQDSGLNVDSGSAAQNLGQLGASGGSAAQGGSTTTNNSSNSSSQAPDPSTFSQYDKYKSDNQALFGDMQVGTGAAVGQGTKVAVYYKGWLTNGQLFDQSRAGSDGKLQPFTFTMGAQQVIPGWEQGLAGMKVGGTRLIIVPPAVGYGNTAQGSIPANSLLVFEVQLLAVQ